jgi:hypothetical protein
MRKTRPLRYELCHQSGLPKHYRKSVMSRGFTEGLVRLTTTDIFMPYRKFETPQWNVWGWSGSGAFMLNSLGEPWLTDNIMWEQFNRGTEGLINTRSRRIPIHREEEK